MSDEFYDKFMTLFLEFACGSSLINKDHLNDMPYLETKKLFEKKITHVGYFVEDIIDIWFPLLAKYNYTYKDCHDAMMFEIDQNIGKFLFESGYKHEE